MGGWSEKVRGRVESGKGMSGEKGERKVRDEKEGEGEG